MTGINPLQLIQMRNNPKAFAQSILNSNPNIKGANEIKRALELANSNDQKGLQELANQICSNRGASTDMVRGFIQNTLGIK